MIIRGVRGSFRKYQPVIEAETIWTGAICPRRVAEIRLKLLRIRVWQKAVTKSPRKSVPLITPGSQFHIAGAFKVVGLRKRRTMPNDQIMVVRLGSSLSV